MGIGMLGQSLIDKQAEFGTDLIIAINQIGYYNGTDLNYRDTLANRDKRNIISEKIKNLLNGDYSVSLGYAYQIADDKEDKIGFSLLLKEYIDYNDHSNNDVLNMAGFGLFLIDRLSKRYSSLFGDRNKRSYGNKKIFFGGILFPILSEYEVILDKSGNVHNRGYKQAIKVNVSRDDIWGKLKSKYFHPFISDYAPIIFKWFSYIYMHADKDIKYKFFKWIQSSDIVNNKYVRGVLGVRIPRSVTLDNNDRVTADVRPGILSLIPGMFMCFLYDKNMGINNKLQPTTEISADQMIEEFVSNIPDDNPIKLGGVVGDCPIVPTNPNTGKPITQQELDDLANLLKKVRKQLDRWKDVAKKEVSHPFKDKFMNARRIDKDEPNPNDLDEYVSKLEKEYIDLKNKIQENKANSEEWKRKYLECEEKRKELKKKIEELNTLIDELKAEIKRLEAELAKAKAETADVEGLKAQIEELKDTKTSLDKELAKTKEEKRQLEIELGKYKKIVEKYKADMEKIKSKVFQIKKEAEKLKARTSKLGTIEKALEDLRSSVAEIFKTVISKDEELTTTLDKVEKKMETEIHPKLVKVDMTDAIKEAFRSARKTEDFYYKIVDEVNRMLAEAIDYTGYTPTIDNALNEQRQNNGFQNLPYDPEEYITPTDPRTEDNPLLTGSKGLLLGQAQEDVTKTIMTALDETHKLIKDFTTARDTNNQEHDRLDGIIEDIGGISESIKSKVNEMSTSRKALINRLNEVTENMEKKIYAIKMELPNRDDLVKAVLYRVKQLQLYYIQQTVYALKNIIREDFAPKDIF